MGPVRSLSSCAAAALILAALPPARVLCAEPLGVRADPPSLVLGTGRRAAIVIEGAAETPPTVTTSVGRIEGLRPLGGGRFSAEYLPPPQAHPQVAIVAVFSSDRWGWTAIPLAGQGTAIARSAPGAAIRVTIGDAAFGPVRADPSGVAEVPVIVPAGVEYAYHRDEPLELNVPPTSHVHLVLGRSAAAADAEQVIPFRVFAVTAAGTPRVGAPVAAEVVRGEVAGLVEVAPGERAGTWRLPPGAAGTVEVTARLQDEPGFVSTAALELLAGTPARIELEADSRRVVAGEAPALALRVRVTDAAANPVDAEPSLSATIGEVSAPVAVGPGAWQAWLRVPDASGPGRAVVTARAARLENRMAIEVAPRAVPAAPPPPRARFIAVAPKAGLAAARGGILTSALAAEGSYRTGLLDSRLAFVLEAGAFVRDRTDAVAVGAELLAIRGRVRYVPVIASARIEHATGKRQLAWVTAGAGVAHVASEVSVGSLPSRSESGIVAAVRAAIGWGLRAGRATPFAEVGLAWHGDPRLDALRGSLTVLTASLGCRYDAY